MSCHHNQSINVVNRLPVTMDAEVLATARQLPCNRVAAVPLPAPATSTLTTTSSSSTAAAEQKTTPSTSISSTVRASTTPTPQSPSSTSKDSSHSNSRRRVGGAASPNPNDTLPSLARASSSASITGDGKAVDSTSIATVAVPAEIASLLPIPLPVPHADQLPSLLLYITISAPLVSEEEFYVANTATISIPEIVSLPRQWLEGQYNNVVGVECVLGSGVGNEALGKGDKSNQGEIHDRFTLTWSMPLGNGSGSNDVRNLSATTNKLILPSLPIPSFDAAAATATAVRGALSPTAPTTSSSFQTPSRTTPTPPPSSTTNVVSSSGSETKASGSRRPPSADAKRSERQGSAGRSKLGNRSRIPFFFFSYY
jgi:hypothetical protein